MFTNQSQVKIEELERVVANISQVLQAQEKLIRKDNFYFCLLFFERNYVIGSVKKYAEKIVSVMSSDPPCKNG